MEAEYKYSYVVDFVEIAKDAAWCKRYNHDYIPINHVVFKEWKPHKWVLDAIENAYNRGLVDAEKK